MEPELGSVDFVKKGGKCVLANERGLGLLLVRQDSRADPFGWWSMVALLSLWGHTGIILRKCKLHQAPQLT